ncbi:hypothetical protein NDU88_006574 [Pleurodeles waltl]|uniref:Uncharacterized protein n=1 Tax=Pleurodeles waltl TaxID=8319 RepID=A0AAV7N0T2_PLEWA|nr:hypothetical protein NDU88_006574 [Pleurodeles waltl]
MGRWTYTAETPHALLGAVDPCSASPAPSQQSPTIAPPLGTTATQVSRCLQSALSFAAHLGCFLTLCGCLDGTQTHTEPALDGTQTPTEPGAQTPKEPGLGSIQTPTEPLALLRLCSVFASTPRHCLASPARSPRSSQPGWVPGAFEVWAKEIELFHLLLARYGVVDSRGSPPKPEVASPPELVVFTPRSSKSDGFWGYSTLTGSVYTRLFKEWWIAGLLHLMCQCLYQDLQGVVDPRVSPP